MMETELTYVYGYYNYNVELDIDRINVICTINTINFMETKQKYIFKRKEITYVIMKYIGNE